MQLDITEAEVKAEVRQSLTELYDSIYPYYNNVTSDGVKLTAAWWEAETGIPASNIARAMRRSSRGGDAASDKRDATVRDQQAVVRSVRNRPEAVAEAISELPPAERESLIRKVDERAEAEKHLGAIDIIHPLNAAHRYLRQAIKAIEQNGRDMTGDDMREVEELIGILRDRVEEAATSFSTNQEFLRIVKDL